MLELSINDSFMYFATIFLVILGATFGFLARRYRYWSNRGIPGPKPTFIIGNMKESLFLKCTEPDMADVWYKKYRDEPYIGFYNLLKPSLLIIDPDLIGKVTEVDFNHFVDHPPLCGQSNNDAILYSLFIMEGELWKRKRSIFSKLFTPMKLKEHVKIFNYRYSLLEEVIDKQAESGEDTDLLKIIGRYVLSVIVNVLYGIEVTKDERLFLDLEKYSEMFLHPSLFSALMFVCYSTSSDFFNFLNLKTFPPDFWNYFSPFTKHLLEFNKKSENVNSGYLVNLINQYQDSESGSEMDHREAVGHIFSFLVASNHTTLITVSYALFLLGQHQEVQEKLREEVDRVKNGNDDITWDNIMEMDYLDAVLNETMRLYTLGGIVKRVCTKEYPVDEKLTIPKGMELFIPVQSLHMDPKYFEEPEKFLPERFLGLEKPPAVFMPFGRGPRSCIGLRMAVVSFKVAVARLLSDYIILPSPETSLPVKKDRRSLFITSNPENGLWVKFQKRDSGH